MCAPRFFPAPNSSYRRKQAAILRLVTGKRDEKYHNVRRSTKRTVLLIIRHWPDDGSLYQSHLVQQPRGWAGCSTPRPLCCTRPHIRDTALTSCNTKWIVLLAAAAAAAAAAAIVSQIRDEGVCKSNYAKNRTKITLQFQARNCRCAVVHLTQCLPNLLICKANKSIHTCKLCHLPLCITVFFHPKAAACVHWMLQQVA